MLVEADGESGAVRLDDEALDALLAGTREPDGVPAELLVAVAPDRLDAIIAAIARPAARVRIVVAGPTLRLTHDAWLVPGLGVLRLAVRPGLHQLMTLPPAHLTAALVRTVRMRPRRLPERAEPESAPPEAAALLDEREAVRAVTLSDVGADVAWRVELDWTGGRRSLTAVDGPRGLHVLEPEGRLRPASNTEAYRILSTLVPVDSLVP
jgi:hypothetical protein